MKATRSVGASALLELKVTKSSGKVRKPHSTAGFRGAGVKIVTSRKLGALRGLTSSADGA
jgi:hypothetical protein